MSGPSDESHKADCQINHAYPFKHASRVIVCWLRGIPQELSNKLAVDDASLIKGITGYGYRLVAHINVNVNVND